MPQYVRYLLGQYQSAAINLIDRRRYPQVDIELIEHGGNRLREFLEAGAIDIAALLVSKDDAIASYQDVRKEPLVVVLQADHPLAGYRQLNFKDLHAEPFILFEEGFTLNQLILAACERRKISPRITARSGQIDFIVDLVTAGLGVAFLPRMLANKYRHSGISLVPLNELHTDWRIALAWRSGTQLPPVAIAWLELAKTLVPLRD